MAGFEVRWSGFRGFKDTGWLELRPLTILIGENGTGKTTLVSPFLLLRQTLRSHDPNLPLKTKGYLADVGPFAHLCNGAKRAKTRFSFRFPSIGTHDSKAQAIPFSLPGVKEVSFEFGASTDEHAPLLVEYRAQVYGEARPLVRRRRPDGSYSINWREIRSAKGMLFDSIRRAKPKYFLFDPSDALALERETSAGSAMATFIQAVQTDLSEAMRYASFVHAVDLIFQMLLGGLAFIGPLRDYPKRVYELSGAHPYDVGPTGKFAPEIVHRTQSEELRNQIDWWISRLQPAHRFATRELEKGVFVAELKGSGRGKGINLADTGFGVSQILPIIVQAQHAAPNSWMITEQPEIHLNPKLQGLLADLFADAVSRRVSAIVETHSEHFLMRVRRLIAEEKLRSDQVALYFTERSKGALNVRPIEIQPDGHIESAAWPEGFFGESLRESMGLAGAQHRRGKR